MIPDGVERFEALAALDCCEHAFIGRQAGIEVKMDREQALARLRARHLELRAALGWGGWPVATGEQVHGAEVELITGPPSGPAPGADGLITQQTGLCLGIYVADCAAIYLVDPVRRAIGLVHSGRKGTELGIAPAAIRKMAAEFGSEPADLVVQLSPCIRPPEFEVDFAAEIQAQCRALGVRQVFDSGANTAAHRDRYYSYRMEMGQTGRMLALLALAP